MKIKLNIKLSPLDKLLVGFNIFILVLVFARIWRTGSIMHLFLIWNIFLAWIPYFLSKQFFKLHSKHMGSQVFFFGCWLLFFPNALYLVTDLIHLKHGSAAPLWFDNILLFSAAVSGLVMAFDAYVKATKYLVEILPRFYKSTMLGILLLSSFGVYLGRFQRWNSWDILQNPKVLAADIGHTILYPFEHSMAWIFTALFCMLIFFCFEFLKYFTTSYQEKIN